MQRDTDTAIMTVYQCQDGCFSDAVDFKSPNLCENSPNEFSASPWQTWVEASIWCTLYILSRKNRFLLKFTQGKITVGHIKNNMNIKSYSAKQTQEFHNYGVTCKLIAIEYSCSHF